MKILFKPKRTKRFFKKFYSGLLGQAGINFLFISLILRILTRTIKTLLRGNNIGDYFLHLHILISLHAKQTK